MYKGAALRQFWVSLSMYCGRQQLDGMPEAVPLFMSNQFLGPSIPQHINFLWIVSHAIMSSYSLKVSSWRYSVETRATLFHNPTWPTLFWRFIDFCNWVFRMSRKSFLKVRAAMPTAISTMKIIPNKTANCEKFGSFRGGTLQSLFLINLQPLTASVTPSTLHNNQGRQSWISTIL